jgi:hypothetical protein
LFRCGQRRFADGAYDEAAETFRRIGDDFGRASVARRAAVRLIDAEVAAVRASGGAGRLPSPGVSGSSARGRVELTIQNDSPETLEILLSGRRSVRLSVPACGRCVEYRLSQATCRDSGSPVRNWTLGPGVYEVVVRGTSERRVNPFSGRWRLTAGRAYSHCFFIVTR